MFCFCFAFSCFELNCYDRPDWLVKVVALFSISVSGWYDKLTYLQQSAANHKATYLLLTTSERREYTIINWYSDTDSLDSGTYRTRKAVNTKQLNFELAWCLFPFTWTSYLKKYDFFIWLNLNESDQKMQSLILK